MKNILLKTSIIGSLFVALVILSSCANRVPFSNEIVQKYDITPSMIKGLQFYISREVDLQRGETSSQQKNTNSTGKLVISSASSLEAITIPKGTEGICLGIIDGNKLKVGFESDDSKYLIFGDPHNIGRYTLMAASWNNGQGKLQYGGKVYYAQPGAANAYLIMEMKKIRKFKKKSHVVGGRKVGH